MGSKAAKKSSGRPRAGGGRVTPKGGGPHRGAKQGGSKAKVESARYTPPTASRAKASPRWWPVVIFGLLGIGVVLIVLDYVGVLPGTPNNWLLLPAVACIAGGLFAAMGYR